MTSWAARAKLHFLQKGQVTTAKTAETPLDFLQKGQVTTAKTAETPLLAVSAVPTGAFCEKRDFDLQAADPFDDRHRCIDCRHLWPGNFCLTHRRAGLSTRELAADFTHLPQRCPAWAQREVHA